MMMNMATTTANKPSYGQDNYNNNAQRRRHSSFGLRAAVSPYDEQGGRVPAVTFNLKQNNKPRGRMNNGNIQPKRNLGNNYGKKNFNPNWRKKFNSAAHNTSNHIAPPPRKIVTEKAIVDYVSPGEDGNELYLFTQGDFVNVKKVEGQPLVIDPNTVIYTGAKKKEGEEDKELWEKLCAESSITVTFDALTWEVLEIVSDEALIWARGQSPPCRRRSSWANNPACGPRERWEQNKSNANERKAKKIKGGSPPERRDKAKKPDPMKRRGSLPSVREFKAAVLSASAPTTMTSGITKSDEDFASRMEKLEKANMELQNQLEEAKTKIKVLEDKSTTQDTSNQEEKSIIQDPNNDLLIEDVKASPVL